MYLLTRSESRLRLCGGAQRKPHASHDSTSVSHERSEIASMRKTNDKVKNHETHACRTGPYGLHP